MLVNGENATLERYYLLKEDNVNKRYNVGECAKAKYLVDKFTKIGCDDAERCYRYFVKCFKSLPECTIWNLYESAINNPTIKSPIKYFIGACRNQMATK